MALGDIQPHMNAGSSKTDGALPFLVVSGTTASIKAGEPVQKAALGVAGASAFPTNGPSTSIRIVGVAASTSTETASAAGTVMVIPANPGQTWRIAPKVLTTWNTQAKYNALVGSRVLIDLTGGVYTILAADNVANGCIVEYLDIAAYPGQVAFSFSPSWDYRNVA